MASRAESSSAARLRDSDSDAAGDARVRRPSSPVHIRSNSVTFGPPKDSPTPRRMDSPSKRYSGLHPRPSLANSRVSSSGALPKRTHSFSANDPNGDVPRPSSSRRNDGSKKKRSSRKSGTRRDARTIDYGLGLLDDPSMLDPATRARIAELEARVDDINPASLPPTQLDLPSPSHDPQQPPPPLLHLPAPVETPPRVEFPRQTPSPRLPSSPSWEDGPPLRPASSNRRRISSVFTDVKDKMGKHPSQRTTKPSNASPLESARAIQELRAENRIDKYRSELSQGTLERTRAVKAQLETRYRLIYGALDKGEDLPDLIKVIKWRRDMSDSRRRDLRHLMMTEVNDTSPELGGARFRSSMMERTESTNYATEAAQLLWLPHLSSLHSRFIHPSGRRDSKEWHVTAQVVQDYVLYRQLPAPQPKPMPSPKPRAPRSIPSTSSPRASLEGGNGVRIPSIEVERFASLAELEHASSKDQDNASIGGRRSFQQALPDTTTTSPRSSVKGFRLSLSGLSNIRDPRRVFTRTSRPTSPTLDGPSSPPLGATEFSFSPSSSRHNLAGASQIVGRARRGTGVYSDDPGSSEMSLSEGVTDADDVFMRSDHRRSDRRRTTGSSRPDLVSASEDDYRPGRYGALTRGFGKPNWVSPLFSRRNTGNILGSSSKDVQSATSGGEEAPDVDELPKRMAAGTHAFTAGFLSQFPRTEPANPQVVSSKWEETQRTLRDHYAERQLLLTQLRMQNDHLSRAALDTRAEMVEFMSVRKLLSSEIGQHDEEVSMELLEAFVPFSGYYTQAYEVVEALHAYRVKRVAIVKQFLSHARAGKIPWLESVIVQDSDQLVQEVTAWQDRLEHWWDSVSEKLEMLKIKKTSLEEAVVSLKLLHTTVAMQIDTVYPELSRNFDLARQLSVTGQTTLPYISSLPPWAREVLGPLIEYILSTLAFLVQFFLHPIWVILPRPIQIVLWFLALLIMGILGTILTSLVWVWWTGYQFGQYLSHFILFRALSTGVGLVLGFFSNIFRAHWKFFFMITFLSIFWYVTTPEDDDIDPFDVLISSSFHEL